MLIRIEEEFQTHPPLLFQVIAPSGKTDDCFIQNIDGDQYSIRFMPRENGVHNINVKFNGVHMPASPLRIKVGKDDADPAAVHCHGPGLGAVKTGELFINEIPPDPLDNWHTRQTVN